MVTPHQNMLDGGPSKS